MDPQIQKAIENKWLCDTEEEAYVIMGKAWNLPDIDKVTSDGNTGQVMWFPWCSGVSGEVRQVRDKYEVCVLVFVSQQPAKPVEPANPYGMQLCFQEAVFHAC